MRVDGPAVVATLVSPDAFEKLVAIQDRARVRRELDIAGGTRFASAGSFPAPFADDSLRRTYFEVADAESSGAMAGSDARRRSALIRAESSRPTNGFVT